MCLIVFAWQHKPDTPLVACANRDEFFARPTAPAHWWDNQPNIYAGRDLHAGGTWMGIANDNANNSRFASITNIRAPAEEKADAPSRGHLVSDYLSSAMSPKEYIDAIAATSDNYNGFNLLIGDRDTLIWFSNRGHHKTGNGQPLKPGIYALSNALLDDPWPKVTKTRTHFDALLRQNAPEDVFFDMLSDTSRAPDAHLPETGVDLETERMLSSICVQSAHYGTRSSTLVRLYTEAPPMLKERVIK